MADNYRIMEIVGAVFGIIFALLGINSMFNMRRDGETALVVYNIATDVFLISFGIAGAVMLGMPRDQRGMSQYFGFLCQWGGRCIYFLVMGFYLYPAVCGGYTCNGLRCDSNCSKNNSFGLNGASLLITLGVIASVGSIILGIVCAVLLCFGNMRESCQGDVMGSQKNLIHIDYMCVVASAGMILCGLNWVLRGLNRGNTGSEITAVCNSIAVTFVMLAFGILSFIGNLRNSSFVQSHLGLCVFGVAKGIFYLCMGFWMYALFAYGSDGLFDTVCWICGILGMVVGVVVIVLECCGR